MGEGYYFQNLKSEILALSAAEDWAVAKKEWRLVAVSEADEPETCLCGHFPIVELCTIANETTGRSVEVGNVCVKRFLGFRSDLIFQSLKRIRKNIGASIGADAMSFFYQRSIINSWEYGFLQNTFRKRNLSAKQILSRRDINEKILGSIRRRGVS